MIKEEYEQHDVKLQNALSPIAKSQNPPKDEK